MDLTMYIKEQKKNIAIHSAQSQDIFKTKELINKLINKLISRHFVVGGLELAVDGGVLVHPAGQLLLARLRVFRQLGNQLLSSLISGHFVVGGLELAVDGGVLVHPGGELLLRHLRILRQLGGQLLAVAGASFGVFKALRKIPDRLLERLLLRQSDGLGGFQRLHVVGDDFVLFSQLHDSGLIVDETIVSTLGLDLKGGKFLGNLVVLLVRVLGNHLGLDQLLLQLLDTLGVEGASALQHFAAAVRVFAGFRRLGEFFLGQKNSLLARVKGPFLARALPLQSRHFQLGLTHELLVLGELLVGLVKVPGGDIEVLGHLLQSPRQLHDLLISGLNNLLQGLDHGIEVLNLVVEVLFLLLHVHHLPVDVVHGLGG